MTSISRINLDLPEFPDGASGTFETEFAAEMLVFVLSNLAHLRVHTIVIKRVENKADGPGEEGGLHAGATSRLKTIRSRLIIVSAARFRGSGRACSPLFIQRPIVITVHRLVRGFTAVRCAFGVLLKAVNERCVGPKSSPNQSGSAACMTLTDPRKF